MRARAVAVGHGEAAGRIDERELPTRSDAIVGVLPDRLASREEERGEEQGRSGVHGDSGAATATGPCASAKVSRGARVAARGS